MAEIPYEFADRVGGQSKMSTREAVDFLFQLRALYSWKYITDRRPRARYRRLNIVEVQALVQQRLRARS
ncbi:MAG: hypothetical protein EHM24_26305 [Acidobacteria bacterium]|nr:MAG: hypothetical protein EHM24_26305 [Acidobacteriota bacterium]